MLFIASLNDQVVPIYSGLFTAISHPLILRALYIDGDAYKFVYSYRLLFQWHWPTVSCLQFIWFPLKPTCLTHPHSQLRNIRLWIDCTSLWSDGWIFDWCWPFVCVWRVNNIFVSPQFIYFFQSELFELSQGWQSTICFWLMREWRSRRSCILSRLTQIKNKMITR